jgi:SET domain-containing protein
MSKKWTAVEVELRASPIHGLGVFAKRSIRSHQLIATTHGAWLWPYTVESAPTPRWRWWLAHYAYWHKRQIVFIRGPLKFVNHSCAPNIVWRSECCFALRDINASEELFEDYRRFSSYQPEALFSSFAVFGKNCRCAACVRK